MTDLFAQQGINFMSSQMASTHPTTTPTPIPASSKPQPVAGPPQDALTIFGDNQGHDLPGSPMGNPDPQDSGASSQSADLQQVSQSLSGSGNGGTGTAGGAPPQPSNNTGVDLFEQQGIKPPAVDEVIAPPTVQQTNSNAMSAGIPLAAPNPVNSQQAAPVSQDSPPISRAEMSLPPEEQAQFHQQKQAEISKASADMTAAHQQSVDLATKLYGDDVVKQWQASPRAPAEGFMEAVAENRTIPFLRLTNAVIDNRLQKIATDYSNNQPISPADKQFAADYIHQQLETEVRGFTRGGKLAYSASQLPAWMFEFAAGDGAASFLATRVTALAGAAGLSQVGATVAGTASKLPLTPAFMPAQYIPDFAERRINASTAITDKGEMVAQQAKESPAKSALMAYGGVAADVASAYAVPTIDKYLVKPVAGALATPMIATAKALPIPLQEAVFKAYQQVKPMATYSEMLTPQGWNNALSAVGSFQLDKILRTTMNYTADKDMTFKDALGQMPIDADELLLAGGFTAIHASVSSAHTIMTTMLQKRGMTAEAANEVASNMSANEKEDFVNSNLPLPQSDAPTLADTAPEKMLADRTKTQGADAAKNVIAADTNAQNAANPPLIQDKESGFNASFKAAKIYAEMWNDLAPIEEHGRLARERGAPILDYELSPAQLSLAKSTPALIERQWTTGTTSWDNEGNQVVTGKGLKQIGDDFDNMMLKDEPKRATRQKDMADFRKAMTFVEDKTKGYSPVSDKDFNESQATLSRLADKYGDKMKWFETFAKEYRDWDNRILHNLVTSGLKTQAWYDDLVGKREWYASTARVVESEYPEDFAATKGKGLGADVNPNNIGALKQRKGSKREVIDQVQSSMRNSAIIINRSMINHVLLTDAKYAEYYPEKVKVKNPAIIRAAVEHNYDPKLRTKLEQLVDFMDGEVKRVQQGEKVGDKKSNLGAYEPGTKSIYLRAGSTEGTLTHEAGHMLDYVLGLKEKMLGDPEMKAELEKLSEDRLRSEIKLQKTPEGKTEFAENFERNPKKYVDYVKNPREVIANFFDAYVNSPKQAREVAPKSTAMFEKMIDEDPKLALLKDIAPSTQRATETIQRELLDFKGPKDSRPFYDNGKLKFLHMDEDTARAYNGLDQVQGTLTGNFIAKIGKAQARLLQFGATNNPYFIVRHFLRGAQSSYVNTPEGGGAGFLRHFAVEIPKGIAAVIGKNDAYREWASSSGALRTYMDTSTKGIAKLHDEMFNKGDMRKFLNPLNWAKLAKNGLVNGWQTAKQVSDYAPRIAAYERLKDKGYSDLEAGFLSLEATGNYIRHGSLGKQINAYSPFFNDRLQGADRFIRAIKRDPAGYSMRAIALITMPQVLYTGYMLFAADEKTRNQYLNLNDYRRSAAMNIQFTKDGPFIPIPRAFAPGYVFGALPEFAMIHFFAKDAPALKNFWLHMLGDAVNSLSPSTDWTETIPPIIKSQLESITNFSFFRQQSLFHGDVNKTAPENQYNSTTSETAKALGKLFGYSPTKIDNTVYDMSAHIGVYAEQLGDYAINTQRRLSGQPVNEKPSKGSDNPIWGPMMQPAPVGTASESFQEFHEHSKDLAQQQNRDNEATGKDKADFEQANHQDLALYPTIARANTEVMHEEHEIRLITENVHLTGDQKAQQIAQHQQRIEIIVEGANKMYRNVKGQK